ncbi:hypothetical protein N1495_03710 [Streptococcus didelphis]|uniref:Niacin transporter NiaX n=1 Tax=Streptococcus didelphis TaxID=102886 RepID=A0ABY9LIY2_9STRE|nr:hypothetical protein [Streptococcus didelphis]WMB28076.1 hypothetical protein N1496_09155 [Streptococcus didelphis]WMB29987.1 hypothetical protein N1495_03710 [Streptococcus didelphis]
MTKKPTQTIAYASILIAFGILIPMIMPIKVIIGPASFTLASHVPIFLASFISLPIAFFVSLGTTLGFFLAGFPIVIVMRALSQVIFALIAADYFTNKKHLQKSVLEILPFAILINIIHGLGEFVAVYLMTSTAHMDMAYIWSLVGLVGFGTLIHGIVDFYLAFALWKILTDKVGLKLLT